MYHSTDLNLFQQPRMMLYEPETSKGGKIPMEHLVGEPRTVHSEKCHGYYQCLELQHGSAVSW